MGQVLFIFGICSKGTLSPYGSKEKVDIRRRHLNPLLELCPSALHFTTTSISSANSQSSSFKTFYFASESYCFLPLVTQNDRSSFFSLPGGQLGRISSHVFGISYQILFPIQTLMITEIFLQIITDDLCFFRSAEKLAILYDITFMRRCFIRSKLIYMAKFGTKQIAGLKNDYIQDDSILAMENKKQWNQTTWVCIQTPRAGCINLGSSCHLFKIHFPLWDRNKNVRKQ